MYKKILELEMGRKMIQQCVLITQLIRKYFVYKKMVASTPRHINLYSFLNGFLFHFKLSVSSRW